MSTVADDRTDSRDEPGLGPPPADSLHAELMRQRVRARMFDEPPAPPQIARFRVTERIGSGGMGTGLARSIALKFLGKDIRCGVAGCANIAPARARRAGPSPSGRRRAPARWRRNRPSTGASEPKVTVSVVLVPSLNVLMVMVGAYTLVPPACGSIPDFLVHPRTQFRSPTPTPGDSARPLSARFRGSIQVVTTPTDSRELLGVGPPADSLRADLMQQRLRERMFGEPSTPPQIARFRVLERIGSGGMGTVYLAWDEGLARSVALKFLHQREGDDLVREAQALARLAHPNVVSVFDVGVHDGRVWLAMEHVPGQTLRAWLGSEPSQAERLRHWIAAGRGLAAVHAAGLIHRDVKPDNVLLGADGRVRLIDFGLVLAVEHANTQASSSESGRSKGATERGGFAGTRAYAPPEQLAGLGLDARADQYALCVAIWEALAGQRPERDEAGRLVLADIPGLARRIVEALKRGLAVEPSDRWPSMAALLDVLEPRRRRVDLALAVGLATSLGLALGFVGFAGDEPSAAIDPCALAGTELGLGAATRLAESPLRSAAEQWIGDWQRVSVESCEARVSEPVDQQRRACLEVRRLEFVSLIDYLASVQAGQSSLDSGRLELGDPAACLRRPDEALELPVEHAEAITEIRQALAAIELRRHEPTLGLIGETRPVLERARTIAWSPLTAEATLTLAELHLQANDRESALTLTHEGLNLAEASGQFELAARAWSTMVGIELDLDLDPEAARMAWTREQAALEQLGPGPLDRARLAREQASIARLSGDLPGAEQALREAVEQFEQAGLSGRLQLLTTLEQLALVVGVAGQLGEVERLGLRVRALERELAQSDEPGPELAGQAYSAFEASQLALVEGDLATALIELERALASYERSAGSESQQAARTHIALAQVHDTMGSFEQAERHAQRADEICRARLGPDHPLRAASLSALGTIAHRRGDSQAAVRAFRVALRIEQTRPGGGGMDVAIAHSNLAEALLGTSEWIEARRHAELALTELEAVLPADHPNLAYPHKALGWALLEAGELAGAKPHLTTALALAGIGGSEVEANEIRSLLARIP